MESERKKKDDCLPLHLNSSEQFILNGDLCIGHASFVNGNDTGHFFYSMSQVKYSLPEYCLRRVNVAMKSLHQYFNQSIERFQLIAMSFNHAQPARDTSVDIIAKELETTASRMAL